MILTYHRISVPGFDVFPLGKKISRRRKFTYPLIVKSLTEEGSVCIAKASYVENETQLRERVALIHEKLYQSTSLARIDFAEYIRSLASMLARTPTTRPFSTISFSARVSRRISTPSLRQ